MRTILKILKVTLTLFIVGVVVYHYRVQIGARTLPLWEDIKTGILTKYFPCQEPIPYNLGTFDTKFNISKKYFLDAMAEAEAVWEVPTAKNLFVYKPGDTSSDTLIVNLIYDYREQATKQLSNLGNNVADSKASYDYLKSKLDDLRASYEQDKADLDKNVAAFNQEQADYNSQVKYWNDKGGAPESEYKKLQDQRSDLESKSRNLQNAADDLNDKANEINTMIASINSIAKSLNLTVKDYNTISTSRGETFEEAIFKSQGAHREIDVYEFSNKAKLVRVLAHELGHALGLEHVDDSKAIMYYMNNATGSAATKADLDALNKLCGIK